MWQLLEDLQRFDIGWEIFNYTARYTKDDISTHQYFLFLFLEIDTEADMVISVTRCEDCFNRHAIFCESLPICQGQDTLFELRMLLIDFFLKLVSCDKFVDSQIVCASLLLLE